MRRVMLASLLVTSLLVASSARADVSVTFKDGAPKDSFTITNLASCATQELYLTIDLITAPAGLIFDVTGAGVGVEVFQAIEFTQGGDLVTFVSDVQDGDNRIVVVISELAPMGVVRFTADIDDTAGGREITVTGSEIAGAFAVLDDGVELIEAAFDETGSARLPLEACAPS